MWSRPAISTRGRWSARWFHRDAPGSRPRPSRGATWCASARPTARHPIATWTSWSRPLLPPHAEHSVDQRLDRAHGLEIFGRDVRLRNGDVELELHREHQVHHFQGTDAQLAQLPVHWKWLGKRGG